VSDPTFSIVITSFNQRAFVTDAVNSALLFRGLVKEIIVVDDASSDGSQDVLARYGDAIAYVPLPTNRGKGGARNAGAARATGDYLIFLDGDDAFLPWALDVCRRAAERGRPKLILCSMKWFRGDLPQVGTAPRVLRLVEYTDYMSKDRSFGLSASSVVFERQTFERINGWSDLCVMQDQDIVFRMSAECPVVHVLEPPTTQHRAHAGQSVNAVAPFLGVLREMMRRERCGGYPGGTARRFDRAALFGGLVLFWVRRAVKAGLYVEALHLAALGWPSAIAALARRGAVRIKGRRIPETLPL
jgi:glycosyltransferase involved in cell wall biosynthesis